MVTDVSKGPTTFMFKGPLSSQRVSDGDTRFVRNVWHQSPGDTASLVHTLQAKENFELTREGRLESKTDS